MSVMDRNWSKSGLDIPIVLSEEGDCKQTTHTMNPQRRHAVPLLTRETMPNANVKLTKGEKDQGDLSFVETVKSIFGPCVGAVDTASGILCRGEADHSLHKRPGKVSRGLAHGALSKKNPALPRRQGGTLVFEDLGGFDDDLSAISQHTLEEMERLERLGPQMIGNPVFRSQLPHDTTGKQLPAFGSVRRPRPSTSTWPYQITRPSSDPSICVSTSGSASTEGINQPIRFRDFSSPTLFAENEI